MLPEQTARNVASAEFSKLLPALVNVRFAHQTISAPDGYSLSPVYPIPAPGHSFYRGYFIQSLEPGQLIEKIEKQIASGKCSGQDEQKLKELAATLTENDNNVLFIGKVKK